MYNTPTGGTTPVSCSIKRQQLGARILLGIKQIETQRQYHVVSSDGNGSSDPSWCKTHRRETLLVSCGIKTWVLET